MLNQKKKEFIDELNQRVEDKILNKANAEFLAKLIGKADSLEEVQAIMAMGTTYKRTGFHFNFRKEPACPNIKYLKKNEKLSFVTDKDALTHKLIIGDNYDALRQLLISYRGLVDIIYIDPPYGKDNLGRFADTNYSNAITRDDLLSMLYTRMQLAKDLLSENGVVFCSIDDRNMAYIKCLFDDIFGENQFVSDIIWQSKYTISNDKKNGMTTQTEHILCYAKNIENLSFNPATLREEYVKTAYKYDDNDGRGLYRVVQLYKKKNPKSFDVVSPTGKVWNMPWNYTPETFAELEKENKVYWGKDGNSCPQKKVYLSDSEGMGNRNLWMGKDVGYQLAGGNMLENIFDDRNVFDYPKPVSLILEILKIASDKNSIVLDFFAGSGTTGQAVLEMNKMDNGKRKFIICTNNEITNRNPNGIAYDTTSKRLKRIMTGCCYDGTTDFKWNNKNAPLGDNLEVTEIAEISPTVADKNNILFDIIDESLYDILPFDSKEDKINWICTYINNISEC
jgi:adenine-specific DNA-methyltransferase